MKKKIYLLDVTDFTLSDGSNSGEWFSDAFDDLDLFFEADLIICDGIEGELPNLEEIALKGDAILISGSYGPVYEDKPWILRLQDYIREAHSRKVWMLGICFGHQALAEALGGKVVPNPRGREMGTVMIHLTSEGKKSPLLKGISSGDPVNISHLTHVTELPESAVRLAFNQMTSVQAFSLGRSFGYQPHPEFGPVQLCLLVEMLRNVLIRKERFLDDERHLENFKRSFMETPASKAVLRNFVRMVRG